MITIGKMILPILTALRTFYKSSFFIIIFHKFDQCKFILCNQIAVEVIFIGVLDVTGGHDYASKIDLISGRK